MLKRLALLAISGELRCLVCRNESIDESNADLARDMRLLLRERLVAGDSDAEAVAYLVDRFGEYVLLRPKMTGENIALYAAGPVMLLVGFGIALAFVRRRRATEPAPAALSPEEEARLKDILER
ncbi:MAG: cytochrome C biogenesis protein CcdA [Alphaproteobacteria bacterium HGW-Alphaproteobacteria-2]|nr:MAG: cytochrome C biogenesis protein CcdA [Alphaproteobacteria bacterium HGW-Alphaproteobacteria-2]